MRPQDSKITDFLSGIPVFVMRSAYLSAVEAATSEATAAASCATVRHEVALHRRLASRPFHKIDIAGEGDSLQSLTALHTCPVRQVQIVSSDE